MYQFKTGKNERLSNNLTALGYPYVIIILLLCRPVLHR